MKRVFERLCRLLLLCGYLSLCACSGKASAGKREELPAAPYEITDAGRLHVRSDILGSLSFSKVVRSDVQALLVGYGNVAFAPDAVYAVRVSSSAFVERVSVSIGDLVEIGTPLASLQSSEVARMRSEVMALRIQLASARDAISRVERLIAQNAASVRELVEARTHAASLQAEIQGLTGQLAASGAENGTGSRFELKATGAGQILERKITAGERVSPDGEAAFLIGDTKSVVVNASFVERDAPFLEEGLQCSFVVQALGATRYQGVVTQVVRTIDPTTRSARVVCRPAVAEPRLRSEMVARVEVEVRGKQVLTIPRSALMLRRDDRVVFVRQGDGTLERRTIEVGSTFGDSVQVANGLQENEVVVSENAVLLDGELDMVM